MQKFVLSSQSRINVFYCFFKYFNVFFLSETTARPPKRQHPLFTYSARKLATSATSTGPKCEPLTIEACKVLGYNYTQLPNRLQHKTYQQAATELSTFLSRLQTQCSPHLIPFLCRLYLPPCSLPQSASPPCRSLCESVQEDCALSPLERWPGHLNCEQFPRANDKAKCFLGSTKTTSKRTALLRGTSVQNEDLTQTNTLKTATTSDHVLPTRPVEIAKNVTEGKATIKSHLPTAATRKSNPRQMADKFASAMTGQPSSDKKGKQMNASSTTANETGTAATNASSSWNVTSSPSISNVNKGGT